MRPDVKLYIFDADGTLRWTTVPGQKYPLRPDQWQLMPQVHERLSAIGFSDAGPWLGIASNQNGVAAGELSEEMSRRLMAEMLSAALGEVPSHTRIELCLCDAQGDCDCRKPAPGLLLRHLAHFRVKPEEALFVGDLDIDAEAARRAGIPFIYAQDFFGWR